MGAFILLLFWIIFVYLSFILIYELVLFLLSKFLPERRVFNENPLYKYLLLIPAYKENGILLYTIDAIRHLNYPVEYFDVILLNDQCDKKVIDKLKNEVKVIDLDLQKHSKIKSLKEAIPFVNDFDFVVVLDADNLVHPEFLMKINQSIQSNTKVIQGLRLPKTLQSIDEKLDSLTDFIYNQLDRIIPAKIGLTGTLSGSGFAIKSKLFVELISKIDTFGGFDKILQSELMLRNIPVQICPDAIVYDEKISETKSYINQRRRWFYFHFYNSFKYSFRLILKGIFSFNFNQFHLGLVSLRLPISLIYLITFLMIVFSFLINKFLALILFGLISAFSVMLIKFLNQNKVLSLRLIVALPFLLLNQIISIFKISEARKNSLKTNHQTKVTIEEILSKGKFRV